MLVIKTRISLVSYNCVVLKCLYNFFCWPVQKNRLEIGIYFNNIEIVTANLLDYYSNQLSKDFFRLPLSATMMSRAIMLSRMAKKSPFPQPYSIQFTRFKTTAPPTYFGDHLQSGPTPVFSDSSSVSQSSSFSPTTPPITSIPQSQSSQSQSSQSSKLNSFRDLSVILSIVTLAYFAIDNYRVRVALESKVLEQAMNQMKSLAIAQNNFNTQRRKRETQVLNERRNAQKREMKMVYHISMLRKQLIDAGLTPGE